MPYSSKTSVNILAKNSKKNLKPPRKNFCYDYEKTHMFLYIYQRYKSFNNNNNTSAFPQMIGVK